MNLPCVKQLRQNTQTLMNETLDQFLLTAIKLSDRETDIKNWCIEFEKEIKDKCTNLLDDINQHHVIILNKMESSLKTIQDLCKILRIEMPDFGNVERCMYEEHELLKKHINDYMKQIEEKRSQVENLLKKEEALCKDLGREVKGSIKLDPLPSENELLDFSDYIEKLEIEHLHRLEQFCSLREEILGMIEITGYSPETDFEKSICRNDKKDNFQVTDGTMEQLHIFYDYLKKEMNDIKEEILALRREVNDLWNMLDVDLLERELFKQRTHEENYSSLKELKAERDRCVTLKKANIKTFIDRLRVELQFLWKKCHCSNSIEEQFQFLKTDCYTEDLLEIHENEVQRWKIYYEENKYLLSLIEKYSQQWRKMLQLEESAANPQRYKNRGGQLLKEEKERNCLAKRIPQMEEELRQLCDAFEVKNGAVFTSFGLNIQEYITSLHEERENQKKQKLSARKLNIPGTSMTVSSACKRKLQLQKTPDDISKKPKFASAKTEPKTGQVQNAKKKLNTPLITVTNVPVSAAKRRSMERNKRMKKIRKLLGPNNDSTYIKFQEEMAERKGSRSTLYEDLAVPMPETPKANSTPSKPVKTLTPMGKLTAAKSTSNLKLIF